MSRRDAGVLVAALSLLVCTCSTKLLSTSVDHQRVTPERPRLVWTWIPSISTNAPVLATKLTTEYLSERVETRRYRTRYTWVNRGCWLVATALYIGAAVKVGDWRQGGGDGELGTSTAMMWALLFFPWPAGILLPNVPLPPRSWSKEVVLRQDTSYQFAAPLADRPVLILSASSKSGQSLRTAVDGHLDVDIRDFYEGLPSDSALRLTATWSDLSVLLVVPSEYVRVARQNESDASALLAQADAAEAESRDEVALALYDSIGRAYAKTRPASQVPPAKISRLRAGIGQARLARAKRDLERVSQERVRGAIGKLNLRSAESNTFAEAVENLSGEDAASVMETAFGLLLSDFDCAQWYRQLTLFQKFYALLRYKDAVGTEARSRLATILTTAALSLAADDGYGLATKLGANMPIVDRLVSIDPGAVLK